MPNTTLSSPAVAGLTTLALLTVLIASSSNDAFAQAQTTAAPPATVTVAQPRQAAAVLTPAHLLARSKGVRARQRGELAAAIALMRPVAESGDPESQNAIGEMLIAGAPDVTADDVEAAEWFRKAAVQGFAAGQVNFGLMLEQGKGVTRDDEGASRWFKRAALEGFAAGQHHLARLYETGKGLPRDLGLAVFWYAKAVNQNFAMSLTAYGVMHRDGVGVTKNPEEAVRLFRRASDQGLAKAQYHLGTMYTTGSGVTKDDTEARRWYQKAADQGLPEARQALEGSPAPATGSRLQRHTDERGSRSAPFTPHVSSSVSRERF